ncbi:pirin family protein [Propionivibrio sp.]|uniref:pirin family protein n=1 Tax=Propionivibrio sp. TaxID=2212460 RepID=UPI002629C018|nr:pirin family protein [Propionivibrio sp.]
MIQLRSSASRGISDHGWLVARHSFSFADYYDSAEMGWGVLRVINEDRVAPGRGFGKHGHRDMEIVTYVIDGVLEHRDSLGNGELIGSGEVQRMSAGSGIKHSEFNPSQSETTHLLQIWIEPSELDLAPGYEQQALAPGYNAWRLIASPDAAQGSTLIHQDARLYAARLEPRAELDFILDPVRLAYVHLVHGALVLGGMAMSTGDGAKIANESSLHFVAAEGSEILLFDLPH